MKRKPSPAIAISLVALFFSLTGAGLAASRYIITSKSQIKPSVLRALKGDRGPQGFPGSQGPIGPPGAPGPAAIARADSTQFYVLRQSASLSTSGQLVQFLSMQCNGPNDTLLTGGFDGQNEVVTTDKLINPVQGPWVIVAHLDPSPDPGQPTPATSGTVSGWILCQH